MNRFLLSGSLILVCAGTAAAADVADAPHLINSNVGHISVLGGLNGVRDNEDGQDNDENVGFLELDASFSFAATDDLSLVLDGNLRKDFFDGERFDLSAGPDDVESLDWQFMTGAHLLHNVGTSSRIGVLAGYGDSSNAEDEGYSVMILGLEGQTFIDESLMLYAQAGWGDKVSGVSTDEGFQNGLFGRIGATFFVADHTALNFDAEHARVSRYVDGNDAGRFTQVSISGETMLPVGHGPISLLYHAGFNHVDTTTEGDTLKEFEFGLGLKFAFGASTPESAARAGASIGLPDMPIRASHLTETMD
jgi:hypothetical protein